MSIHSAFTLHIYVLYLKHFVPITHTHTSGCSGSNLGFTLFPNEHLLYLWSHSCPQWTELCPWFAFDREPLPYIVLHLFTSFPVMSSLPAVQLKILLWETHHSEIGLYYSHRLYIKDGHHDITYWFVIGLWSPVGSGVSLSLIMLAHLEAPPRSWPVSLKLG